MLDHQIFVVRHRKENLKKCSLKGLENRNDIAFITYPCKSKMMLPPAILLTLESNTELTVADSHYPIVLLDGTWKLAKKMEDALPLSHLIKRRLPPCCRTAYPRRQTGCALPLLGLASVEALAVAYYLLGKEFEPLLEHYYWKEDFLSLNYHVFYGSTSTSRAIRADTRCA